MQFLWWHWVVLGIVLTLLELAVPSFFLVWFGLGALIVGITLLARLHLAMVQGVQAIQDIKPSESMVKSMEMQAAERERKAVVTRAEGEKQAMILEAEGRLESAKRDVVAQVTLAESASQAIQKVAHAVGDRDTPMLFLLGEKYIQALDKMSASQNSKIVLLPGDLQDALRGVLGKARSA